jgi:hypothetical protein
VSSAAYGIKTPSRLGREAGRSLRGGIRVFVRPVASVTIRAMVRQTASETTSATSRETIAVIASRTARLTVA